MERIQMKRNAIKLFVLVLAMILMTSLPAAAQDDDPIIDPLFEIIGEISFVDGDILVDGIIVAPASAFIPATLSDGDTVLVIGFLLNDDTLQAVSLEVITLITVTGEVMVDENGMLVVGSVVLGAPEDYPELQLGDEVTVVFFFTAAGELRILSVTVIEADEEDDPEPEETAEPEPEITPEPEPDETPEPTVCVPLTHPVANRLAAEFEVDVTEILGWHCDGFGFGEIARALLMAEADDDLDYEDYLALKAGGLGWGQIMQTTGLHPSALAPGRVISGQGNRDGRPGGRPDHAGPPEDRGGGPPDHAGPPEDRGGGRPDHAGPPGNRPGGGNPGGGRGGGRP
jgi:hypothetical protein